MIVLGRCTHCARRLSEQTVSTVSQLLSATPLTAQEFFGGGRDSGCLVLLFLEACGVQWRTSAWGLDPSRTVTAALDAVSQQLPRVDGFFVHDVEVAVGAAAVSPPWAATDVACVRLALAEAVFDCALSDDRPMHHLQSLDASVVAAAHTSSSAAATVRTTATSDPLTGAAMNRRHGASSVPLELHTISRVRT